MLVSLPLAFVRLLASCRASDALLRTLLLTDRSKDPAAASSAAAAAAEQQLINKAKGVERTCEAAHTPRVVGALSITRRRLT